MRFVKTYAMLILYAAAALALVCFSGPASAETETAVLTTAPNVPPPIKRTKPATVVVNLETKEFVGTISDGVEYELWTINGTVPGPMFRVRVGDTVEVHVKNAADSKNTHTIDFHAVNGPDGGASGLATKPGEESVISFKTLNPGFFIYHCATPPIPQHIANGLYGAIIVEPAKGMPKVDRELYVMQSEFYTSGKLGEKGMQKYSDEKGMAETPEYIVFNGRTDGLMGDRVLKANVGETVRLYFANIGPNKTSSFHIIGEIFDRVWREGALPGSDTVPDTNIQTTMVPSASTSVVEFKLNVPASYLLVDHSIYRILRGAVGILQAEGKEDPSVYQKIK